MRMVVLIINALLAILITVGCNGNTTTIQENDPDDAGPILCEETSDCPGGMICVLGECRPMCVEDADCPDGMLCNLETSSCITEAAAEAQGDGDGEDDVPLVDGDSDPDGDEDGSGDEESVCATLLTEPQSIEFDPPLYNVLQQRSVTLSNNDETANLIIQAVSLIGSTDFSLPDLPNLQFPRRLRPGEQWTLVITYTPSDPTPDNAVLSFVSDSCSGLLTQIPIYSTATDDDSLCRLEVDPENYEFPATQVGRPPAYAAFTITYPFVQGCDEAIRISSIALSDSTTRPFALDQGALSSDAPKDLLPGDQHLFVVSYWPDSEATAINPHITRVFINSDSPSPDNQTLEVRITGITWASGFSITPDPLVFPPTSINTTVCDSNDDCPDTRLCINEVCAVEQSFRLRNWHAEALEVTGVFLNEESGDDCSAFHLETTELPLGEEVPPGGTGAVEGWAFFAPQEEKSYQCQLDLLLHHAGEDDDYAVRVRLEGDGRPVNEIPIARASLQSHGPIIQIPITGVSENTRLCFYGNIAYDPDGELTEFDWSIERPAGSLTLPILIPYIDIPGVNMCADFDLGGDYTITLKVRDNEGQWSSPFIIQVTVDGNEGLRAILQFDAGVDYPDATTLVDMDLLLSDSIGATCRDDTITSTGSFTFPQGHGTAIMPRTTPGAGAGGTVEELVITNPTDGLWRIGVHYVDDCMFDSGLSCLQHLATTDYRIRLYDPNHAATAPLFAPLEGEIAFDETIEWILTRVNGIWNEPVLVTNETK